MEAFVAVEILWRQPRDLRPHVHRVGVVIEETAVVEIDPIERQDRHDVDVALRVGTTACARYDAATLGEHRWRKIRLVEHRRVALQREQLLDEMRDGEHGRAHVEYEAVDAPDIGAPADVAELLDDLRIEAEALQADRAGDAADPRSDYDSTLAGHDGRLSWESVENLRRSTSSRSIPRDNRRCGTATVASDWKRPSGAGGGKPAGRPRYAFAKRVTIRTFGRIRGLPASRRLTRGYDRLAADRGPHCRSGRSDPSFGPYCLANA